MSKLKKGGYILKKDDNIDLINEIKKELTVSPKNYFAGKVKKEEILFKVYQEDDKYLYIPKYYGLKKLGKPDKNKEKIGKNININFKGQLRDYQKIIVNKAINHIDEKDGGLISVGCGQGKCLGKNTKIIMYDGSIKKVQDIIVGEKLMGDDGKERNVKSISRGIEMMYNIKQSNGIDYVVNESHILSLMDKNNRVHDIALKDYLKLSEKDKSDLYGFKSLINKFDKVNLNKYNSEFKIKSLNEISDEIKFGHINDRNNFLFSLILKFGKKIKISMFGSKFIDDLIFMINSVGYTFKINENILNIELIRNIKSKITVEKLKVDNYYGFSIDGNRRFLLEDFTVTHNTIMSIYLACHFKVKTLIIVHKTFLLNQWLERIKEFTDASVGILQQNKIDTKKDFVVGMLQSIAKDKYDSKIFKKFGFVIFDEAHHAPSQYFSKALPIISCKKTLALTATPYRSDGLEKILYWYFGDTIHKSDDVIHKDVIVNMINYSITDPLFREYRLPFNGMINKPKIITNITKIKKRNDFIFGLIEKLYENESRNILILTDRIEHLKVFENMIKSFHPEYSYGFYIGGMTQKKLDFTSSKRIILASYGMAEEGLDIKKLNTLILATPRTNVKQSIGRIVREKNNNALIIDIIDDLPCLVNQSKTRQRLYKKLDYGIKSIKYVENKLINEKDITNEKLFDNNFNPDTIDFV